VIALLGIGRPGSGDDALGPVFARAFRHPAFRAYPAFTAPENLVSAIRRDAPSAVVVLDAALLPLPPGAIRRVDPATLESAGFGTHAPDPLLLHRYLLTAAPAVHWVAVRPSLPLEGHRLSPPVKAALRALPPLLLDPASIPPWP
jgi:hydrogenase 3 maturation protease